MSNLIKDCMKQFRFVPRAIVLSFIVFFAYSFIKDNNRKEIWNKTISVLKKPWLILYLLYLSYILICTLLSRQSFVPYKSVLKGFRLYNNGRWSKECIENILLFVPYTFFFLQALVPEKSFKAAFLIALSTSLFVEISQLIFWLGAFQFSDIFYNVLGGLVGWILWHTCNALMGKMPEAMRKNE